MAFPDLWAVGMLLAAFAGGAFGASIGALPSFALAGVMVIVGEIYAVLQRTAALAGAPVAADVPITGAIAFGPVLGPHVAFGGGAAAAAYAAREGYLDTDFDYHDAKNVTRGLGARPDVLAVGGAFGIVGYWIATLSATFSIPVDPVALGVVGSAFVHRAALGYHVVGDVRGQWLDMSPFEAGRRRGDGRDEDGETDGVAADGGAAASIEDAPGASGTDTDPGPDPDPDRYLVEPWLPYQYRWPGVTVLGLALGVLGAYVAWLTTSPFLAFGISVAALVYVNADIPEIPITHHVTLPASTVVLAYAPVEFGTTTPAALQAAVPLAEALVLGAAFGVVGALAGELCQRVLYAHAETHLDPPAASIVLTSLLIGLLAVVGVFPDAAWIPTP